MATDLGQPPTSPPTLQKKRLIVCCDGTWMDSDYGLARPTSFGRRAVLQVPSNVTRISHCFKRRCVDGTLQIVLYESGVGTGCGMLDCLTGGAFGAGLAERVRVVYAYLCANYSDGDEIFLVGFSRGAFTARSVAGMVAKMGLLTRTGVQHFYPIFKDMKNWRNQNYHDPFPDVPFANKPKGSHAHAEYRKRLVDMGFSRVQQANGQLITVKAVCVWDTVGSLGIPRIAWLEKLGIRPFHDEYNWHDTSLSDRIEHAFQALALDETRSLFSPAIWERPLRTHLRQVWFPGNHGNCGGGWDDQGMANCSLAWMMDQMASVGVEFDQQSLQRVVNNTDAFYFKSCQAQKCRRIKQWAVKEIYDANKPLRPWGLGAIRKVGGLLYLLSGEAVRTPGRYKTVLAKATLLQDTNERIHSSVRVRLACRGLGLDDGSVWSCEALADWKLERARQGDAAATCGEGWIWKYVGDERDAPANKIMMEEPLGFYERALLDLCGGKPNVYEYAERRMRSLMEETGGKVVVMNG